LRSSAIASSCVRRARAAGEIGEIGVAGACGGGGLKGVMGVVTTTGAGKNLEVLQKSSVSTLGTCLGYHL